MKKICIIGAGGHGKVVADIAILNGYEIMGFLDDNPNTKEVMGFPVLGKIAEAKNYIGEAEFCVSIGNTFIRKKLMTELIEQGATFPILIHPNSVIGMNVTIGAGTVVVAGAIINPEATIGEGCIINTCASVDHDCVIHDYVHVAVGARVGGVVEVGESTWIGAGAVVRQVIRICENCTIGAGAVVVKDIDKPGVYVGIPAKLVQ